LRRGWLVLEPAQRQRDERDDDQRVEDAGRHRLELGLSTVVGFATFHLAVHRVQLRVE
jgi:hypothetical protein